YSAATTQNFVEAHVKNGRMFEYSTSTNGFAAGAVLTLGLTVPAGFVCIVKAREIQYDLEAATAITYEGSVFTGGTPVPLYNMLTVGDPSNLQLVSEPTVTTLGTQCFATTHLLGPTSGGTGNRNQLAAIAGLQRVLGPGQYILKITNTGSVTGRIRVYSALFEGDPEHYVNV
ncbi:hypothetical protein, partial [Staphylococcus aureus]|uniref:hypothetical protein n=1 Tax=Staphylococcus aureus TaxID=1280 RepID=UPI00301D7BE1